MLAVGLKLSTGLLLALLLAMPPAAAETAAAAAAAADRAESAPIVIAHRGASGLRPEHTLAAYRLALLEGVDFIEPDVVVTRDGVLIARHENLLAEVGLDAAESPLRDADGAPVVIEATTDVAERPEFASRLTVKLINGRPHAGWFSEDFTLAEIKTLWARERMVRLRPLNRLHDRERVPTLAEIIDLVREFEATHGRKAGLYIETKQPTYFRYEGAYHDGGRIAVDLAPLLLTTLDEAGFTDPRRLYVQSFELEVLLTLHAAARRAELAIPLVQLFADLSNRRYRAQPYDLLYHQRAGHELGAIYGDLGQALPGGFSPDLTYVELATPAALEFLARFVSGVGVHKQNVLLTEPVEARDIDGDGAALQRAGLTGEVGAVVGRARAAGLEVHAYTLRAEEPFLLRDGERVLPAVEEALRLLEAGVTGLFADQPSEGRAAVDAFQVGRQRGRQRGRAAGGSG